MCRPGLLLIFDFCLHHLRIRFSPSVNRYLNYMQCTGNTWWLVTTTWGEFIRSQPTAAAGGSSHLYSPLSGRCPRPPPSSCDWYQHPRTAARTLHDDFFCALSDPEPNDKGFSQKHPCRVDNLSMVSYLAFYKRKTNASLHYTNATENCVHRCKKWRTVVIF